MTDPTTAPALECCGVRVARGGRTVLDELSLTVHRGQVTTLLGPNGAGKTTVMQALAGLLPLEAGTVLLEGRDVSAARPVSRSRAGLASVEQGRTVFGAMTTRDNLRIAGGTSTEQDDVGRMFPELIPKMSTPAGLLSGGEQQMLMLARALVRRPSVLLVDEMSLGLAPVVVRRMLPLLRRLAVEQDIAVLLVEQFAVLALQVADHAYVLRRGAVTFDGPAEELLGDTARLDRAYFGEHDQMHGVEG